MLSLQNIRSPEVARSYFSKDNYYSKDALRAEYFGEGARVLSLLGEEVTQERFVELLRGKMTEDEEVTKHKRHRSGDDLTFSAPKSVSITALAIDDKQLNADMIEAHRAAVDHALRYLEKNFATTRTMDKKTGRKIVEQSGNIIAVKFEHDTSRELDPQLHTHCVVVNATFDENGKWRALNNEEFFNNRKLVGVVYQAHLAQRLREKGYQLEPQANGTIELTGYSKEQLEYFSTRRAQIEEYMGKYDLSTSVEAEVATLKTRRAKTQIERPALHEAWYHQSAVLGIDPHTPERNVKIPEINPDATADSALRYAVAKLFERNSVMKEKEFLTTALTEGLGRCDIKDIEDAYTRAQDNNKIVVTQSKTVVTQLHLDTEKENIAVMEKGKGAVPALTDERIVAEAFVSFAERKQFSLSEGQQNSARLILTTQDRVVGVEGYAGTGKTTMLELVRLEAEKAGYTVNGYCPSSAAAAVLKKETGMETNTLAGHLINQRKESAPPAERKELWIIDEASMISTMQANELLKAAEKRNARLVFLGDRKQLASIEAGKPFAQLIDNGMAYEKITEIRRQKNEVLREAVYESMDPEKIVKSISKLKMTKIPDRQNRLDRMVGDYLGLPSDARGKTLLLTSTNDDRRVINEAVRTGLRKEGKLTGPTVDTTILVSTGLTKAELGKIANYHEGQMLRFGRGYKRLEVKNGDHAAIIGVDKTKGSLTVETPQGRQLTFAIANYKNIELYNAEARSLQKGDTIRFTKNDKQQKLMNGLQASVVRIDPEKKMVTLYMEGRRRIMQLDEIRYLDHAYATTVHSSQGLTCDRVLANMDTKKELVLGQEAFYVTISRAKEGVALYTDDPDKLPDVLQKSLAQRSALEEIARVKESKPAPEVPPAQKPVPAPPPKAVPTPVPKPIPVKTPEPPPRSRPEPVPPPPPPKPEPRPVPVPKPQPPKEPPPPPKVPPQLTRKEQLQQIVSTKEKELQLVDTKLREIKKEAQPLHDAASKVKRELGKLGQQHKLVQKHELRMKELEAAWEKCGSFNVPGMLKIKKQKEIETQEWEAIKGRVMQGTEPDRQQLEREIARLLQEQKTIEHTLENVVVRATPYEEKKSVLEKERGTASKELDSIERDERRAKQKLLGEDHEHGRGR